MFHPLTAEQIQKRQYPPMNSIYRFSMECKTENSAEKENPYFIVYFLLYELRKTLVNHVKKLKKPSSKI